MRFYGCHLALDGRPGARLHLRVVCRKIGARHREIEGRQRVCFVLDVEELFGRSPVFAPKATLLARLIVLAVKDAVRSPEEAVFGEHGVISGSR